MKQKKLRGYVLPTIYVALLMIIFGTVSLISSFMRTNPNYMYSTPVLGDDGVTAVISTDGSISDGIIRPYISEAVVIDKYFYDINSNEDRQAQSLIYFENTYMKNTGVLYTAPEEFDCLAVLDGTITNIREDEILGTMVEMEYNPSLRIIYYSLNNINVKVGDVINQGEIIGKSGKNNIGTENNYLLLEVYLNGALINPEEFYNMDITTLSN